MNKKLIIDCEPFLFRLASIESPLIKDIHYFFLDEKDVYMPGTIFKGRINRIEKSLDAAFIDIGMDTLGFLPHPSSSLHQGDTLLVQLDSIQSTRTKWPKLTTDIYLVGESILLFPGKQGVHLSKKIKPESRRKEIFNIGLSHCPNGFSLVMRTAWNDTLFPCFQSEIDHLINRWEIINNKYQFAKSPCALYYPENPVIGFLESFNISSFNEIYCNSTLFCNKIQTLFQIDENVIHFFPEKQIRLFDNFGVEKEIDKALKKKHYLPGGGTVITDYCEAFTIYDVNSGKDNKVLPPDDKAYHINLEAIDYIFHHIRLCSIGGIILVDLIDMKNKNNRDQILLAARKYAQKDCESVKVYDITSLGILEITRKRRYPQLQMQLLSNRYSNTFTSDETARRILRQIKRKTLSGQKGPFHARCSNDVALLVQKYCTHYVTEDVYINTI